MSECTNPKSKVSFDALNSCDECILFGKFCCGGAGDGQKFVITPPCMETPWSTPIEVYNVLQAQKCYKEELIHNGIGKQKPYTARQETNAVLAEENTQLYTLRKLRRQLSIQLETIVKKRNINASIQKDNKGIQMVQKDVTVELEIKQKIQNIDIQIEKIKQLRNLKLIQLRQARKQHLREMSVTKQDTSY